jgi:hypothetical protein
MAVKKFYDRAKLRLQERNVTSNSIASRAWAKKARKWDEIDSLTPHFKSITTVLSGELFFQKRLDKVTPGGKSAI